MYKISQKPDDSHDLRNSPQVSTFKILMGDDDNPYKTVLIKQAY